MTNAQIKAVEKIKRLTENELYSDRYEIKTFEVKESEYSVSVYVVYGLKDDEGTMAEVYCRDRAHLFVGKRGGITYYMTKKLKNGAWKTYKKVFKGYSILQAVCDQR